MMYDPEFSRLIAIEGISPDKVRYEKIEATPEECEALAKRFDLRKISGLKARLNIRRIPGGDIVRLEGAFEADIIQACVVSLQDVPAHIQGSFETFFTEDASKAADETTFDPESAEDLPELAVNGQIDLGEIVAQYLALDIDIYPRAPGVNLSAQASGVGTERKSNPFQILEGLIQDKE